MEKPKRARRRKPDTAKADLEPAARNIPEGRVSGAIRNPKGRAPVGEATGKAKPPSADPVRLDWNHFEGKGGGGKRGRPRALHWRSPGRAAVVAVRADLWWRSTRWATLGNFPSLLPSF